MSFFARFAISPGGALTVAQARLALANRDLAREGGGFALRFDDTGQDDEAARERVRQDLRWLGIVWDAEYRQAERGDLYAAAIGRLQAAGRLYPCFENEEELRAKRERRARAGKPAIYDRAMLKLTAEQRATAEAKGKRPYWRFLLSDGEVTWKDACQGRLHVKLPAVSDPVLVRADGTVHPLLAGAIDDIDMSIGLLARGADEVTASAIQWDIRAALGSNPGRIALRHLPALRDANVGKRARGLEKLTIRQLRQDGVEAAALVDYLTRTNDPANATPHYDSTELLALNRRALAATAFADIAARLPERATETFWHAIRGHIDLLPEARAWWHVVAGEILPPETDGAVVSSDAALAAMPPAPWDARTWSDWLACLPPGAEPELYRALTGEEQGPPMDALLPLIGPDRAARRLRSLIPSG